MKKNLIVALVLAFAFVGCSSTKKTAPTDAGMEVPSVSATAEINGDSDSGKAGDMRTVFFAFNSSELSADAKSVLDSNVEYLKANPTIEVQIEGHCDERGGVQYNIALGEKRAQTVRNYLMAMGVASSRITMISFGKERPLSFGHDEDSWGQNRRGNFVITAK